MGVVTSCARLVRVYLQITDNQTVGHYEVSLAEKCGWYINMLVACAAFQTSKVVQWDYTLNQKSNFSFDPKQL